MSRWVTLGFVYVFSLLVGFMIIVQWSLVPAQNHLPASAYAMLEQGMNAVLKTLTPALMITALALGVLVLLFAFRRRSNTRVLYVLALISLVVMIVSTLLINAPINDAVDAWDAATPPADWQALRDRWEWGHMIRAYVGAFGLLAAHAATIWDMK